MFLFHFGKKVQFGPVKQKFQALGQFNQHQIRTLILLLIKLDFAEQTKKIGSKFSYSSFLALASLALSAFCNLNRLLFSSTSCCCCRCCCCCCCR